MDSFGFGDKVSVWWDGSNKDGYSFLFSRADAKLKNSDTGVVLGSSGAIYEIAFSDHEDGYDTWDIPVEWVFAENYKPAEEPYKYTHGLTVREFENFLLAVNSIKATTMFSAMPATLHKGDDVTGVSYKGKFYLPSTL